MDDLDLVLQEVKDYLGLLGKLIKSCDVLFESYNLQVLGGGNFTHSIIELHVQQRVMRSCVPHGTHHYALIRVSLIKYHTWKAGSALLCRIINKKIQKWRSALSKIVKKWILIINIKFYQQLDVCYCVCFLCTTSVDFIFVDFDKILDKFIIFEAFFWGIIFCQTCFPSIVLEIKSSLHFKTTIKRVLKCFDRFLLTSHGSQVTSNLGIK